MSDTPPDDYVLSPGGSESGEIHFVGRGGRKVVALAHGPCSQHALTQDARYLYTAEEWAGTVTRVFKDGGLPIILATDQAHLSALTYADGWLYWARTGKGGGVARMPAEGGEVELVVPSEESVAAVAVHRDTVAWSTFGDGLATGTVSMTKLGGPTVTLATKQKQPAALALDDAQLYWACHGLKRPTYFEDGYVVRRPREGSKRYVVAKNQRLADGLVTDDTHLYWSTAAGFAGADASGGVWKRRKDGGEITRLARSESVDTDDVAVDATHVYWLQRVRPALFRVAKGGGEVEVLMRTDGAFEGFAHGLVVDERNVYWTAFNHGRAFAPVLFKMAK